MHYHILNIDTGTCKSVKGVVINTEQEIIKGNREKSIGTSKNSVHTN
jgi:hypothetical protein